MQPKTSTMFGKNKNYDNAGDIERKTACSNDEHANGPLLSIDLVFGIFCFVFVYLLSLNSLV